VKLGKGTRALLANKAMLPPLWPARNKSEFNRPNRHFYVQVWAGENEIERDVRSNRWWDKGGTRAIGVVFPVPTKEEEAANDGVPRVTKGSDWEKNGWDATVEPASEKFREGGKVNMQAMEENFIAGASPNPNATDKEGLPLQSGYRINLDTDQCRSPQRNWLTKLLWAQAMPAILIVLLLLKIILFIDSEELAQLEVKQKKKVMDQRGRTRYI
jgi:hypothetical protein